MLFIALIAILALIAIIALIALIAFIRALMIIIIRVKLTSKGDVGVIRGLEPPLHHPHISVDGEGFVLLLHPHLRARPPQLPVHIGVRLQLDAALLLVVHLPLVMEKKFFFFRLWFFCEKKRLKKKHKCFFRIASLPATKQCSRYYKWARLNNVALLTNRLVRNFKY